MPTPENVKPFKTYDEQISLLKSRGLIISDDDKPAAYLYAIFALLPDSEKYPMLTQIARAFRKYPFAKPQYLGLPENWFSLFESMQ